MPLNDSTWHHDGYFHLFKESLCNISDNLISWTCPRGNESSRHRALLLLKSGAMQLSVMQYEHCKSRLKDNLKIFLLRIDAAPSMKTKVSNESVKASKDYMKDRYTIFLEFDENTKHILFCPCSMCGFYDGLHMCSHFTGFLFLILWIQWFKFNQELFEQ